MNEYINHTIFSAEQLPRRLNIREINDRWRKFHKDINAAQPLVERKRVMRDGTVKTDYFRRKVLSAGILATGLELIKLYVPAYEKALLAGIELQPGEIPSMHTNGTQLGKRCGLSGRSMRTHLAKMAKHGFVQKRGHGPKCDYEVWVTPKFLFGEAFEAGLLAALAPVLTPKSEQSSGNIAQDTPETKEKETTQVDKCGVALQQCALPGGEGIPGDTFTSDTGPQLPGESPVEGPEQPLAAKKPATGAGGAARPEIDAQKAIFMTYVNNFWTMAWKLLYPNANFTPHHERMAKNAIWTGVYRSFINTDMSQEDWHRFHLQVLEQLKLSANYFENHPDKYAPMPYAEFKPGTGYFDAENDRGFRKTFDWWKRQQVWKQQQKANDALRRAERELRLHKQGKLRDELQKLTPLQLFRMQENRLKRYGKGTLDKFYAQHAPQL